MKCKIVAKVLYDYDAQTSEELTLKENNVLLVIDDSDPDWWTCILRVSDTFEEAQEGLAPVTYIEELEPKLVSTALYEYEARTEDEISFQEGATVLVYENDDPEWWFARIDNNVGLVPANYVNADGDAGAASGGYTAVGGEVEDQGTSLDNDAAAAQKAKLLNTLDMFGPGPKIPKGPKADRAPGDVKLTTFTEVNKKSKKNNRKVLLGVGDDYVVYLCDEFETVLEKWDFKELTKFSEKKGKKVFLDFGSDSREFEGEKDDVDRMFKRLEEIKTRSMVSGPIITGPPPNVGPPPGSLTNHLPSSLPPPAPAFSPATFAPPPVAPSPVAMSKGAMKVAIALYDYEATTEEELSIQENDDLIVIDDTDEDWWQVKLLRGGGEGLVPKSYVELKQAGADISRADEDAERRRADEQEREMERAQAQRMAEERRRQDEEDRRRRVAAEEERQRRQKEEEERRRKEREEEQRRMQRIEEEARRQEQSKPSLPSRPAENARSPVSTSSYRPPMPQRAPEEHSIPSAVPRLPTRPATSSRPKSQGEDGKGKGPLEKPNETKIRTWTDRSGSFKVDAEFLNVAEGKVHLHKTNGVKIAVPVEKLSPEDLDYVRRVTGNGSLGTGSSAPKPRQGVSAATLASAAAAGVPPPPSSSYVYNGFDWRDWLLKAGVSTGDALIYAQAFVNERMDKSVLDDIDRDVLRRLGVSEGDIIRIRKYATTQVAFMGGNANAAAIAERERLARANNMAMLGRSDGPPDAQILADEAFARELQKQELMGVAAPSSTSAVLRGNTSRRTTAKTATIDAHSVLAMKQALNGGQQSQTSPPSIRASSSAKPTVVYAPPPTIRSESTPEKPKPITNDPWEASSLGATAVNSAVAAELQKQAATTAALQAQLLQQQQAQQQLAAQQNQFFAAQQQAAIAAKKQAEQASAQLQQQQAVALNAKRQAELALQQQQIEAQKVEAQKAAALNKMREETARLEAQLAEQRRIAAARPLQQPLIPTPSANPNLGFVPVSNQPMSMMAGPGAMGMMALQSQGFGQAGFQQTPQPAAFPTPLALTGPSAPVDPNDKYAALRSVDATNANSFSSNAMVVRPNIGMGMQQPNAFGMQPMQPTPAMGMGGSMGGSFGGSMGNSFGGGQMGNAGMGNVGMGGSMGMGFNTQFGNTQNNFGGMGVAQGGGLTPQQMAFLQQQQQQQQGMMPGQYGR